MFVPKVAKAHTKAVESPTRKSTPRRSTLVGHRFGHDPAEQALFLQRSIGNQAALRLLARRDSTLTGNWRSDQEQDIIKENTTTQKVPRGVSWDFGKIALFPPEGASRAQRSSPLTTTPLPGALQAKLVVGQVNDPLEYEADRVADQVMRMPDPGVSVGTAPLQVSRKCAACEEEEQGKTLQMKLAQAPQATGVEAPPIVRDVLSGRGRPLDAATAAFFEGKFGQDFSRVRIHNDHAAARSAGAIGARAYTFGNDIVFNDGEYRPGVLESQRLIAHELTHVIQQGATPKGIIRRAGFVALSNITVNHDRVTVPPVAGLSLTASKTPANASGVSLSIVGDNAAIAAGTMVNNATGAITVAADQTGGSAHVLATQTEVDPTGATTTTTMTAPLSFTAIPIGIVSTTASASGVAGNYGGDFTHTFGSPGGGNAALEQSHVNEQFSGASGTNLTLKSPLCTLTIAVNNPGSPSAGWDLDSSATMTGVDHVIWGNACDARPFVANASHPSPSPGLPQELTATQNFRNLTFPSRSYASAAVASTTHRRAVEDRNNTLQAVTSANAAGINQEVVEDYAGPTVFRRCRATPASIPVTTPAAPGAPPSVTTSTIAVDAEGQPAAPTFNIRQPDLGCTITSGGVLTPGATAGTVTVRAGDATNFDETTVTLTPPPTTPPPSPNPNPNPGP
jgi:hypothetical protein